MRTTAPAAIGEPLAVSVPTASKKSGLSRSMIYVLFNQGELGWIQIGRRRLVEIAELERFLASRRVRRCSIPTGTAPRPAEGLPPPAAE